MRPLVVPFFIPHLGCPHRCVFCDQEKVAGARSVLPAPEKLLVTIDEYARLAPGRELEAAFYGGTFTALPLPDQETLLSALRPLLDSGKIASVRLSTRPDCVDPETASFLVLRGVRTVELGVQSMDPEVLSLSGRGHDAACVGRAVRALKDAGIEVGIQLMPGLPGDSPARAMASLHEALSLDPSFLRIYPTVVISGTELAQRYLDGSYRPLPLDEAVSLCAGMLLTSRRAGVPVVRMGLQPTEHLQSPGTVLAGPWHPAFRQLVESEIMFRLMCLLVDGIPAGSRVSFHAAPGRLSDLVGQKRSNLREIARRFGIESVAGEDAALARDAISLSWCGATRVATLAQLPVH